MYTDTFVTNMPWPPAGHDGRLLELSRYNDLFEGNEATIRSWVRQVRNVTENDDNRVVEEFVAFPSPEIAARTLATFLFGEDARIRCAEASDELVQIIEDNHLHALNQEAAVTCCVDGEIFYKLDWDEDVAETAIISAVPSRMAFPRWRFRRLVEVAFVTRLDKGSVEFAQKDKVFRHVEIRERGRITHRLFAGSDEKLGDEIDLERATDLEGLESEVVTELDDVLVRHVPLWRTSASPQGISIYRGKQGLISALHALYTQDQHDAEMSKRRVAIANSYLRRDSKGRPVFDRNLDLFELSDEAAGAIGGDNKPIHSIEFNDNTVQGQRIAQRLDEFLLACGIAPQSAGRSVAGAAESGTARKLAQSLTLQTVATAGRYFKPALRDVVDLALEIGARKLGRTVPAASERAVSVEMADGLATDERELSLILQSLTFAKAASTETKVRILHPDWEDDAVEAEVEKINIQEGLVIPDVMAALDEDGNLVDPNEPPTDKPGDDMVVPEIQEDPNAAA